MDAALICCIVWHAKPKSSIYKAERQYLRGQKAVSAHFTSKQILPLVFAEWYCLRGENARCFFCLSCCSEMYHVWLPDFVGCMYGWLLQLDIMVLLAVWLAASVGSTTLYIKFLV